MRGRGDRRRAGGGADAWGFRGRDRRADVCIERYGEGSWRALPSGSQHQHRVTILAIEYIPLGRPVQQRPS